MAEDGQALGDEGLNLNSVARSLPTEIATPIGEGHNAFAAGQFEMALQSYEQALEQQPECEVAWYYRGLALFRLQRLEAALVSLNRSLELDATLAEAWLGRGQVLRQLQQFQGAIGSYNRAISLQPDLSQAWCDRGDLLQQLKRYPAALQSYDRALAEDPMAITAWRGRAVILWRLNRYEDAIASYDQVTQHPLHCAEDWVNRACLLSRLQRYEDAIASYDRALELQPDAQIWSDRGHVLRKLAGFGCTALSEDAIDSYDQALELSPHDPKIWHHRGLALRQLERWEGAIANFDQALALRRDFLAASRSKVFVLVKMKQLRRYYWSADPIEREKAMNDAQNLLRNLIQTKLPALTVVALSAFFSLQSVSLQNLWQASLGARWSAIAVALGFLGLSFVGDWIDESKR